jgi:hypothetical protein
VRPVTVRIDHSRRYPAMKILKEKNPHTNLLSG